MLTFRTSIGRELLRQAAEKSGHVSFEQSIEAPSFAIELGAGSPAAASSENKTAKMLEAIANAEWIFMELPRRVPTALGFSRSGPGGRKSNICQNAFRIHGIWNAAVPLTLLIDVIVTNRKRVRHEVAYDISSRSLAYGGRVWEAGTSEG
jgi:hypothetical protein